MQRQAINPWLWQDSLGFAQSIEVVGAHRMIVCAGQTSVDEGGTPVHIGYMAGQIRQAMDNLEAVLTKAGYELSDIVRLNIYTTDVDQFFSNYSEFARRIAGIEPASTLLGVTRLAFPELLVELEATAMK
jgi:enamine deaminase RidA (YjgF/YER057c/UK114 family)